MNCNSAWCSCTNFQSVKTTCCCVPSPLQLAHERFLWPIQSEAHGEGSSGKPRLVKVAHHKATPIRICSRGSHYLPEENSIKLRCWKCKVEGRPWVDFLVTQQYRNSVKPPTRNVGLNSVTIENLILGYRDEKDRVHAILLNTSICIANGEWISNFNEICRIQKTIKRIALV